MITLMLLGLGCASLTSPPTAAAPLHAGTGGSAEDAPKPDGADAIYRALSGRDGAPPCSSVEALSTAPVEALLFIVDHATQPPWAGVRAAECLAQGHAAEIQPTLERWVSSTETRGFGLIAINYLDQMPPAVALPVARVALRGPLAEDARPRLQNAVNVELRALVAEAQ